MADNNAQHHPRIVVLAGGIGGSKFIEGLLAHLHGVSPDYPDHRLTVIANTGDDFWLHGLKICPDLDTIMYRLGGAIHREQDWGVADESFIVSQQLRFYGQGWDWFTLGDKDIATHIARTALLREGLALSAATAQLYTHWRIGITILPMSEDDVPTLVEITNPDNDQETSLIHFEQWWVQHRAKTPAHSFVQQGVSQAQPAPGVTQAIAEADLIIIPPSNPVVSVGMILGVPGIVESLRNSTAPIVGVSPIIGDAPVRGMADACLTAVGVETSSTAVAVHYQSLFGLDGWLIDQSEEHRLPELASAGISAIACPLWMHDIPATARIAANAVNLGSSLMEHQSRHG